MRHSRNTSNTIHCVERKLYHTNSVCDILFKPKKTATKEKHIRAPRLMLNCSFSVLFESCMFLSIRPTITYATTEYDRLAYSAIIRVYRSLVIVHRLFCTFIFRQTFSCTHFSPMFSLSIYTFIHIAQDHQSYSTVYSTVHSLMCAFSTSAILHGTKKNNFVSYVSEVLHMRTECIIKKIYCLQTVRVFEHSSSSIGYTNIRPTQLHAMQQIVISYFLVKTIKDRIRIPEFQSC